MSKPTEHVCPDCKRTEDTEEAHCELHILAGKLNFSERDLREIYYALDTKMQMIEDGVYGEEEGGETKEEWAGHFKSMMKKIEESGITL